MTRRRHWIDAILDDACWFIGAWIVWYGLRMAWLLIQGA